MERHKWSRTDSGILEVWAYIYIYIYIKDKVRKTPHHPERSNIKMHKALSRQPTNSKWIAD
jgi:hypothetical protein